MIFYHGTDNTCIEGIFSTGLNPSCLTTSLEQAWYYAETTADINETEPAVLKINISPENHRLVVDFPAIEDPLTYSFKKHDFASDDDFHEALDDDQNKEFFWPDENDWKTSLFLTDCLFCHDVISPTLIDLLEE